MPDALLKLGQSSVGIFVDSPAAISVAWVLVYCVNYPICVFGTLANLLVMWVWSSETGYHPTSYLFKVLALVDTLVLVSYVVSHAVEGTFVHELFFFPLVHACRQIGVQITMLLAVVRVVGIFFPLHSKSLFSRFRMRLVLTGFTLWDISMQAFTSYLREVNSSHYLRLNQIAGEVLGLLVPAALQIVLMTVVMWRVWRSFRITPAIDRPAVAPQQDGDKTRRLVYTVFAMCLLTFISYFVGGGVELILENRSDLVDKAVLPYRLVIYRGFETICTVNSSVNIVFYYFIGKFKAILFNKMRRIGYILSQDSFSDPPLNSRQQGATVATLTTYQADDTLATLNQSAPEGRPGDF